MNKGGANLQMADFLRCYQLGISLPLLILCIAQNDANVGSARAVKLIKATLPPALCRARRPRRPRCRPPPSHLLPTAQLSFGPRPTGLLPCCPSCITIVASEGGRCPAPQSHSCSLCSLLTHTRARAGRPRAPVGLPPGLGVRAHCTVAVLHRAAAFTATPLFSRSPLASSSHLPRPPA